MGKHVRFGDTQSQNLRHLFAVLSTGQLNYPIRFNAKDDVYLCKVLSGVWPK
jgi:hypothetical protein